MKDINKGIYILLTSIILGASLIFSSYIISNNNNSNIDSEYNEMKNINTSNDVMTLEEMAMYLKMTKDDVLSIIKIEQERLHKYHSFSGKMFPYFKINNDYYVYKEELQDWLEEASFDQREYDTKSNTLIK